ncbi:aldose epimerase family protein [Thetidibacter halocola]|uniref:Galactose mutarotase n=1 Tax=Thetidibacter halocola TaxID=2827239 RepID=A0A8J7WED7_9RHOB|nr:aldose epimerase family protein [Thetidibacter halocola]MBS0123568.1 galactose mutarotase [Thetidibacter halocola]
MTDRFGTAPDGSPVQCVQLRADWGNAAVMTWGASLQDFRLSAVDRSLLLGSPDFDAYPQAMRYYGAIVGPVANRIAGGRFTLNGQVCELDRNEGGATTLHGGSTGLSQRNWRITEASETSVTLEIDHPYGLGGFPGPIAVSATYALRDEATLEITIRGQAAAPCLFNPAFHGYWNLDGTADLSRHRLTIHADRYLPVDARMIPTNPVSLDGSDFDHRQPRAPHPDVDHNFCIAETRGPLRPHAVLEAGGIRMDLQSTEPGLQVYSAARMDTAPWPGHTGRPYGHNAGLALEPQGWPDAPNRADFPPVRLEPGANYIQQSLFRFSRTA